MNEVTEQEPIPYSDLVRIADRILEQGEEDPGTLARALEWLDPAVRKDLFSSDLLNAFQVFYYFFREDPGDLETDRLILQPASALATGVVMLKREFFEVIFSLQEDTPVVSVSDGLEIIADFRGHDAYRQALLFLEEVVI